MVYIKVRDRSECFRCEEGYSLKSVQELGGSVILEFLLMVFVQNS